MSPDKIFFPETIMRALKIIELVRIGIELHKLNNRSIDLAAKIGEGIEFQVLMINSIRPPPLLLQEAFV